MYCAFEENFMVQKTNIKEYLNLDECYNSDFTHMAIWICKKLTSQRDINRKSQHSP
jgi:hypothetical protein